MPTPETHLAVKNEIAKILKTNLPGLGAKALIDKTTSTDDIDLIQNCLDDMRSIGDITFKHLRYEITPVGRSSYSELNADNEQKTMPGTLGDTDNSMCEAIDDSVILPVNGFLTPDSKFHPTRKAAQLYLVEQALHSLIDRFLEEQNIGKLQRGIARKYIFEFKRWEAEQ